MPHEHNVEQLKTYAQNVKRQHLFQCYFKLLYQVIWPPFLKLV